MRRTKALQTAMKCSVKPQCMEVPSAGQGDLGGATIADEFIYDHQKELSFRQTLTKVEFSGPARKQDWNAFCSWY